MASAGGLVDVDAVYNSRASISPLWRGQGRSGGCGGRGFSRSAAGELLGVGEAGFGEGGAVAWEDDGGGHDGAEEGAAADFVDAGDGLEAVIAESLLGGVGADELLEHLCLAAGVGEAEEHRLFVSL